MNSLLCLFIVFIIKHCLSASITKDKDVIIDDEHILEEYDEVEIVEETAEPEQRAATGRVITGKDCEYIKLCSITANSGCTNGEDEDNDQNTKEEDDDFREQVCDKARRRGEKAVSDSEWWGNLGVCQEGEEVHQLLFLHRDYW